MNPRSMVPEQRIEFVRWFEFLAKLLLMRSSLTCNQALGLLSVPPCRLLRIVLAVYVSECSGMERARHGVWRRAFLSESLTAISAHLCPKSGHSGTRVHLGPLFGQICTNLAISFPNPLRGDGMLAAACTL